MNPTARPRILPLVLAELIDAAPSRLRKRLDKEPDAAAQWEWQATIEGWLVSTGDETVTLLVKQGVVESIQSLRCSCLLSPRCFHILACVNTLDSVDSIDLQLAPQTELASTSNEPQPSSVPPLVNIDAEKRKAARQVQYELGLLTRLGGRRADLLRQSGLLRAAHACRAAGLVNLGNSVLQVVECIRRLRDNSDTAEALTLAEGLAHALQQSERLLQTDQVPLSIVGQARREFLSCDVGKLLGICAEPILTLSGYAGVVVYLQGIDSSASAGRDKLFTVNHTRPGESQWIAQSYRGGIDMGNQTLQAAEVCRSQLLVQNLSVSADGRLGKGTSTRWVLTERSLDLLPLEQGRFGQSLAEQIDGIFASAAVAVDERAAGWDLIAFDAQVLGAQGASLAVQVHGNTAVWKLRIAIDNPQLPYRENLSLLARCPGLELRCMGRLRLQSAGEVDLLAIAHPSAETRSESLGDQDDLATLPKLKLDEAWKGVCNLGFERLQRTHVEGVQRWSSEVTLDTETPHARGEFEGSSLDGLEPLRRRQVAIALGGRHAVAELSSQAHRRDRNQLKQRHQHTAVQLLELLAVAAHEMEVGAGVWGTDKGQAVLRLDRIYLANHLYLQSAARHFQKHRWMSELIGEIG